MTSVNVNGWNIMPDKVDLDNHTKIFKGQFDSWIYRLSNSGSLASDTDEQRLRKAVLILLAGICTTLGIFWGVAYLALGRPLAGSFPLGYSVISTISLVYFFRSRGYQFFCRGQLALILILPVLLQWSLGGFAASGGIEQVICDVNRQLAQDVQDTGRFMTLFMTEIYRQKGQILWLNAGHEPAIIYTPKSNVFDELAGRGSLPLGITDTFKYKASRQDISPGQIIAIATDGIFETQNPNGEMFGRQRFYDIIRQNASRSAGHILKATLEAVDNLRKYLPPEDDLTLVVVKVKPNPDLPEADNLTS